MKEIENDSNKWKDILYSQIGSINIVKISMIAKEVLRLNESLVKVQYHL